MTNPAAPKDSPDVTTGTTPSNVVSATRAGSVAGGVSSGDSIDDATAAKTCRICGATKPLNQFPARKGARDGRRNDCCTCNCRIFRAVRVACDAKRSRREHSLRMRAKYPEKVRARNAARQLVRLPCERCGATRTDAHHDDYSRPLDVRWLCRLCHAAHHAALARTA